MSNLIDITKVDPNSVQSLIETLLGDVNEVCAERTLILASSYTNSPLPLSILTVVEPGESYSVAITRALGPTLPMGRLNNPAHVMYDLQCRMWIKKFGVVNYELEQNWSTCFNYL